ncbi:peptidase M24, structural domain-containing protein [Mycotypha africana]|uniref:peptidase M24, structural domain-containing protein n=1 Tax=Mycotypha africana TaxID=64632 RepID=UPI00230040F0|nr:peptidase M24, structural domain-containing protein [Mycotypha africana]KAI8987622.1 peptidase M24, structural domain-containing protein [Mycotypha africana]
MADNTNTAATDKKKPAETVLDVSDSNVQSKYKDAGKIADDVLDKVIKLCVPGAKILDVCIEGDKLITAATGAIYNKKKMSKGIGFPTSISVNNCVAHFSPLPSDPEAFATLKEGDVAKIQLGAQFDGYCSTVATTIVVGAKEPVTGPKADVIKAAETALEAAIRMIRPGNKNMDITKTVDQIAEDFGVKAVEGMLSHNQLKDKTDGEKQIILNPTEAQLRDFKRCEFAENEVYAIDILISTGEGKVRPLKTRTTIYKKTGVRYQLKMAASRAVFSEIQTKAGAFPFTLRSLEDERKARMGIVEAAKHQTVLPYDVVYERDDAVVAQYLATIMVTKNGNTLLTNPRFDAVQVQTDKKVKDEEINKLLASSYAPPKKEKK